MSCIEGILTNVCLEIERELKPNLQGMRGLFVRGYLPQIWVFETEIDTTALVVDLHGNSHVEVGAKPGRDVTIRWKHDLLADVLRTRTNTPVPSGIRPVFMFHTSKGRAAFNYLRGRLGL